MTRHRVIAREPAEEVAGLEAERNGDMGSSEKHPMLRAADRYYGKLLSKSGPLQIYTHRLAARVERSSRAPSSLAGGWVSFGMSREDLERHIA